VEEMGEIAKELSGEKTHRHKSFLDKLREKARKRGLRLPKGVKMHKGLTMPRRR